MSAEVDIPNFIVNSGQGAALIALIWILFKQLGEIRRDQRWFMQLLVDTVMQRKKKDAIARFEDDQEYE